MSINAKKDRMYNRKIDNIIYEGAPSEKKKKIENVLIMPMINYQG